MADRPHIVVLAGPNGAGKSSAAKVILPESLSVPQFVNADLIAQGLSPFAPESMALEAGRLMLKRIHELTERGESFGFETTLASRSYARFLTDAQEKGYWVSLSFVWLNSVELALSRIADRVQQGGHNVPADVVRRRYPRAINNFFDLYRPLVDRWFLWDNSLDELSLVAEGGVALKPIIRDAARFQRIQECRS